MRPLWGMRHSTLAALALAGLLGGAFPAVLPAQDDSTKGKIGDVERSAGRSKGQGDDDDEGGSLGSIRLLGDIMHAFFGAFTYVPVHPGQGYLEYPYAEPAASGSFVLHQVEQGRTFGAFTATYFADDESSLRATHFQIEWAGGQLDRTIEYSYYREPLADHTDQLHLFRLGFAGLPPVGDVGYVKVGLGVQTVFTDRGDGAIGPEVEVGTKLFPVRPVSLGASARLAPLQWVGGSGFGLGFVDLAGTASVFVGRIEIEGGYRWTRIGLGTPFHGPTLGMRVWF